MIGGGLILNDALLCAILTHVYHGHDAATVLAELVGFLGPIGLTDVLSLADILDHIEASRMIGLIFDEEECADRRFEEWVDLLSEWVDTLVFVDSNWFAASAA